MSKYVLDSNIVSLIVKDDPKVHERFRAEFKQDHEFLGCPFVYFEVKRGLRHKNARKQMLFFDILFADFDWQDFNRQDYDLAAEIWAKLRRTGKQISDADLMIGVFALNRDAILVTNNTKDFAELGVKLENWTI